jgi:GNAT superfamily N-acetyltransferase
MDTIVGVFQTKEAAQQAAADLTRAGIPLDEVNLLLPGASEKQVHSIPTSDTEQPGVGGAIAGAVGGALGIAGGFELGIAVSALIPGVGPVLAAGIAGAALLGIGGAAGGAAIGSAADVRATDRVPPDEIFLDEDARRQGRARALVLAQSGGQAAAARQVMAQSNAESLDSARESWWVGLRDAEAETNPATARNSEQHHHTYPA